MVERWRAVPGFEGLYEVSSHGRVRSLGRFARMLKLTPGIRGYFTVHLSNGSKRRRIDVHSLVLLAFIGPRPAGMQARHYPDRCRTNNRLSNLSWTTPLINQHDRITHGTDNKGKRYRPRRKVNNG